MALYRGSRAPWVRGAAAVIMFVGAAAWAQQGLLANVQTLPDQGAEHTDGLVDYGTTFPTSGAMSPSPIPAGYYPSRVPSESLVHSLEHGHIVIYFDQPGEAAMTAMQGWTQQYQGGLDGVIAVRVRGMGPGIALTAWTKLLILPSFDEATTFAFIDAFRGRGPERAVR